MSPSTPRLAQIGTPSFDSVSVNPETGYVPMPPPQRGDCYILANPESDYHWGRPEFIDYLQRLAKNWCKIYPDGPVLKIGDISLPDGSDFPPHKTHRDGLTVDLYTSPENVCDVNHPDQNQTIDLLKLTEALGAWRVYYNHPDAIHALPNLVESLANHNGHCHVEVDLSRLQIGGGHASKQPPSVDVPAVPNPIQPEPASTPPAKVWYWPKLNSPGEGEWRTVPANSTVAIGEGFPQTFDMTCHLGIENSTVNVNCDYSHKEFGQHLMGRWKGYTGLRQWSEKIANEEIPVTFIGITMYIETLSVPGHTYYLSVPASSSEHRDEVVVRMDPSSTEPMSTDVQCTFIHADIAQVARVVKEAGRASPTNPPQDLPNKFKIPETVRKRYPDLIVLLLKSPSIDDEERQFWFRALPAMEDEQVRKLRKILLNEKRELKAIGEY